MKKSMKKLGLFGLGLGGVVVLGLALLGPDWRALLSNPPMDKEILFWSQDQRTAGFRMMDRVPFLIKARPIKAGVKAQTLPQGTPLDIDADARAYMQQNSIASVVILEKGKLRYEGYSLDFSPQGRWTSFSVAKSLTSTLVGAAIKDGYINSLDDKVSDYIQELKGSVYDRVTLSQLLTMTSGVDWNEDYSDPKSDVALFNKHQPSDGLPALTSYMRRLKRAHPPGKVWHYSTGETNMIGILVRRATGKSLTDYLAEKIWQPYGMEADASWLLSANGAEISGCCIQATTRDFARFGQFILDGGQINGTAILPEGWLAAATGEQVKFKTRSGGYGYQWWTYDDGAFAARGIFGQAIYIDPKRQVVIASNGNWFDALGKQKGEAKARDIFHAHVIALLDQEKGAAQ